MSRSESLRERLALMKATLDREPVGIALLSYPELRYAYANPAMSRVLGTDPVGRLQDETCSDFPWPPRARLRNVAERGSRLTSRDSRWVMPRIPGAEPQELFFTFEVSRVMVGQTVFLLATAVETTDEVEARRRIDEVVDQMQEVLDCVSESILSLDDHWRLTFANRQAAEQFGCGRQSLLHKAFVDLFGEYEARRMEEQLRPAMEHRQPVAFEMTLAGNGIRYRIRAFPARMGITVYLAPMDSSGLADVRTAEEKLGALLGLLEEPVTIFDGSQHFSAISDAACELFGVRRESVLGRSVEEVFGERESEEWLRQLSECLAERRAFRVHARHQPEGPLIEHRGVPVEDGTVMVSRAVPQV